MRILHWSKPLRYLLLILVTNPMRNALILQGSKITALFFSTIKLKVFLSRYFS